MALITKNPTANQSADATLGGSAVTNPSNTGHDSTQSSASGVGSTQLKTCRWHSFTGAGNGQVTAINLKFEHTSEGVLTGGTAGNAFEVDYSTNGGGAWTAAVVRSNFTAAQGPTTHTVALAVSQDLTQVQVRDLIEASSNDAGDSADAFATIGNVRLEITTIDNTLVVMM